MPELYRIAIILLGIVGLVAFSRRLEESIVDFLGFHGHFRVVVRTGGGPIVPSGHLPAFMYTS